MRLYGMQLGDWSFGFGESSGMTSSPLHGPLPVLELPLHMGVHPPDQSRVFSQGMAAGLQDLAQIEGEENGQPDRPLDLRRSPMECCPMSHLSRA